MHLPTPWRCSTSATRPGGLFVRGGTAIWDDQSLAEPRGDGLPLLVAVDDEGGSVQPMEGVLDELPSAASLAEESPEGLTSLAADRGAELRALGINMVFAPVLDVGSAGGIGDRSFGDTSDVVTSKAGAYAAGLRSARGAAGAEALPRAGARRCGHPRGPVDHTVAGAAPQQ